MVTGEPKKKKKKKVAQETESLYPFSNFGKEALEEGC